MLYLTQESKRKPAGPAQGLPDTAPLPAAEAGQLGGGDVAVVTQLLHPVVGQPGPVQGTAEELGPGPAAGAGVQAVPQPQLVLALGLLIAITIHACSASCIACVSVCLTYTI